VSLVPSSKRTATHVAVQIMDMQLLAPAIYVNHLPGRSEVRTLETHGYIIELLSGTCYCILL
jgi:hypothetical protein